MITTSVPLQRNPATEVLLTLLQFFHAVVKVHPCSLTDNTEEAPGQLARDLVKAQVIGH